MRRGRAACLIIRCRRDLTSRMRLAVFHDVFVPWQNVFVYRNLEAVRALWFATGAQVLGNTQAQVRLSVKVKFCLGLARKIAAKKGIDKIPSVCGDLGELASLAAVVEGMVLAAEASAVTRKDGVVLPNAAVFVWGDGVAVATLSAGDSDFPGAGRGRAVAGAFDGEGVEE